MGNVCGQCLPFGPWFGLEDQHQQEPQVPNLTEEGSGEGQQPEELVLTEKGSGMAQDPQAPGWIQEEMGEVQRPHVPVRLQEGIVEGQEPQVPVGIEEGIGQGRQPSDLINERICEAQQWPLASGEVIRSSTIATADAPDELTTPEELMRFDFKIRGRTFTLELPAECTQVESGDNKLVVFEGGKFDPLLVEFLQVDNPELHIVLTLDQSRLVVMDCVPLEPTMETVEADILLQMRRAQMRFGVERKWLVHSPGMLHVYRERRKQFHSDMDITDCEATLAADSDLLRPGREEVVYYDLPMLLALVVMAESDDPADIDRKCKEMVKTGAALNVVGLYACDPARPGMFDGTVKVYERDSTRRPELGAVAWDPLWNVVVEEYHWSSFFKLDGLHPGMRLYMPTSPELALADATTGVGTLLTTCCDVRDPEEVKRAINFVGSLKIEDSNGRLCMVEAAKAGDTTLLDYMHLHGASLDGEDAEGISPYLAARAHQRAEACKWFEERGFMLPNAYKALEKAIRRQKRRVVEYLLLAGESKTLVAGEEGYWSIFPISTALLIAKREKNGDAVKMIEAKSRDPGSISLSLTKVKAQEAAIAKLIERWRPPPPPIWLAFDYDH